MSIPFWKSPPLRYLSSRSFKINFKQEYPSNFIKTSRYTVITFFPVSLLRQFKRYANIYFLIAAIIQSIPQVSPLNPFSAIAPLIFVLGLSMFREGLEDFQRHRSDNEVNGLDCTSLKAGKRTKYTWTEVRVGDLVVIESDEMFPADILVLGSVFESGVCYIETSSLDGEKNLKPKSALAETQKLYNSLDKYSNKEFEINAQKPTQALYDFEGDITLDKKRHLLGPKQLLLRGAFLRNTKWIIGVVVYTGEDSKIMLNAEPGRIKESNIEEMMNKLIIFIFLFEMACCCVSAVCASWWMNNRGIHHWYVWQDSMSPTLESLMVFFSYFLLYNAMIPISLIVSLEFVKVFQAYFIEKDEEMYVAARKKFAKAQTSTINEELGQVEYIFSDKTGTLTCNQMEFKYCIIGNILYGKGQQQGEEDVLLQLDQSSEDKIIQNNHPMPVPQQQNVKLNTESKEPPTKGFNFKDEELMGIIKNEPNYRKAAEFPVNIPIISGDNKSKLEIKKQKDLIDQYFFLLSSAHECLVQTDEKTGEISYQGPSPDEITLVDAAFRMGYQFKGASASQQEFVIHGKDKKVDLLNSFEFDSTRKRMSVIIRDSDGLIKVLIKGADNIIKARLSKKNQPFLRYIEGQLDEFSKIGLRTLLMAMKVLSDDEYSEFSRKFQALADSKKREEELNKLTSDLEQELMLIGATAVEDKLQYQVPETIADLLKANIKVWMLTGDKLETAENIAKSCRLIQGDYTVMRFAEKDEKSLSHKLVDNKETYDMCIKEKRKKSFIVEGESLALIIGHQQMEPFFISMARHCESVVCCRVTPKQKAQVVKLIKSNLNKITLAIGDGANDVNMIQEAHIGVGLYGNEGMRAVQSSDFALGEFRCLWRLLLVHGHWSYIRIGEMILYFFYKNMIFTIPQFFFAFFAALSGQTFFDDWYITFYNLFFTALPLIARATFDQDVNYRQLAIDQNIKLPDRIDFLNKQERYLRNKFPLLYFVGQQKTIFTYPNFIFWTSQGFVHGGIVFFFTMWSYDNEILKKDGIPAGLAALSITVYTTIIFIVDLKIALYTKFWTCFNFVCLILLSIFLYFAYFVISHFLKGTFSYLTPLDLLSSPQFYLIILLLNGIVFIFDLITNYIVRELYTSDVELMVKFKMRINQIASKVQKKEDVDKRIQEIQDRKKELDLERQWGDSFIEELIEEKEHQNPQQQIIVEGN